MKYLSGVRPFVMLARIKIGFGNDCEIEIGRVCICLMID